MEWHSYHRLDLTKVNVYNAVIVSNTARIKLLIAFASSMDIIEFLNLVICSPDR